MKKLLASCLWVAVCLIGCQADDVKNSVFDFDKDVTKIEVVEWETGEFVREISNQDFIRKLMEELTKAKSSSTASMDFLSPDYRLYLIHEEVVLYELGYYVNALNLGVLGRYWDFREDVFYGVTEILPVRNE